MTSPMLKCAAASWPKARHDLWNSGEYETVAGRPSTILDLAGEVRRILGSSSEIRLEPYETDFPRGFEDTRRRVPDVTRAREILGFEARVDLAGGLARTLDWCRQNYELAVPQ